MMLHDIALWGGLVVAPLAFLTLSIRTRRELMRREGEIDTLLNSSTDAMHRLDGTVERALVALQEHRGSAGLGEGPSKPASGKRPTLKRGEPSKHQPDVMKLSGGRGATQTAPSPEVLRLDRPKAALTAGELASHVQRIGYRPDPGELLRTLASVAGIGWTVTVAPCGRTRAERFVLGAIPLPDKYQMWVRSLDGCSEVLRGENERPGVVSPRKLASC